jgi:hypothetical protein
MTVDGANRGSARCSPTPIATGRSAAAGSRPDRADTYIHSTAALDSLLLSSSASNLTINYRGRD